MNDLPTYLELKSQLPSDSQHSIVSSFRQTIRDILTEKDTRRLLIVGPCSIHDPLAAIEYASKLKMLSARISDHFFLLMRVYFEKPRTTSGWKGFLYDPYLDNSNDIKTGIKLSRELLLELATMQIPTATEFLDPLTAYYYDDLISWGSIGARTTSSQTHRQLASALTMPIGFKNGVAGNICAAINGVLSASLPHTFMGLSETGKPSVIQTSGNRDAHIVLRGGNTGPNFDADSIKEALYLLNQAKLPLRLLVDCSHQNSKKDPKNQPEVFQSVLDQMIAGNQSIRGLMIESHLNFGKQNLAIGKEKLKYGVSITDGCIDWETTEQMILQGAACLIQNQPVIETLQPIPYTLVST